MKRGTFLLENKLFKDSSTFFKCCLKKKSLQNEYISTNLQKSLLLTEKTKPNSLLVDTPAVAFWHNRGCRRMSNYLKCEDKQN